jgi:hypothetical protein
MARRRTSYTARMNRRTLARLGAALLLCAASLPAMAAPAADAEFAVRWDPREGGPATPEAALRELKLEPDGSSRFEIEYYDFVPPPNLPPGFDPILRRRFSDGKSELTFKLRGPVPLPPQPTLKQWDCPLGQTKDRKDEVDLSFLSDGKTMTAYSRSCDLGAKGRDLQPPAALQARPRGCASTMTRLRAGKLKIEQWQLADGTVLLEASRPGRQVTRSVQAFEREVLKPLLALQVRPLQRSKSAIGGECAK